MSSSRYDRRLRLIDCTDNCLIVKDLQIFPRSTASSNDNRIHAQSVESADTLHDQLARIFALRPRITDDHLHIGIPPM